MIKATEIGLPATEGRGSGLSLFTLKIYKGSFNLRPLNLLKPEWAREEWPSYDPDQTCENLQVPTSALPSSIFSSPLYRKNLNYRSLSTYVTKIPGASTDQRRKWEEVYTALLCSLIVCYTRPNRYLSAGNFIELFWSAGSDLKL